MDFWPFSYFKRKSEERRNTLKAEILAELTSKTKSLLDEQGKSVKEDGKRLVKEFSKEIKGEKKSLESQMHDLLEEFTGIKHQSEQVSGVASAVKKDSERIKVYSEEAKTKAESAEKGVLAMDAAAKRANELCDKIDDILGKYTENAVAAAVEKCTATVKAEMDKAVQEARNEYKVNIEDHRSLIEEGNSKRMAELSKKLEDKVKAELESFKKECQSTSDNLKKECKTELDAFKKNYAAAQDDYQKIMPRIDAAAQKFKKLEDQINRLEEAIHDRPQYLVTAYLLTSVQRKQLRELYSDKFKGDTARYRKYLEEWRDSQLKGKRSLTPAELEIDFVPRAFENMLKFIGHYTRDELYQLLDVVDLLAGIKADGQANNARPGSGRYNQH